MPFDGSTTSPEIAVFRALLATFDDEKNWLWRDWRDGPRVCLEQALAMTCTRQDATPATARAYLMRAVLQHHPMSADLAEWELVTFNDRLCSGIEELRDTIRLAVVLAENYRLDRLPHPPADPEPYRPGVGWGGGAGRFRGLERATPGDEARQLFLFRNAWREVFPIAAMWVS